MNEGLMKTILRGFLPGNKDRFHFAHEKLSDDMFSGVYHDLWTIICRVENITGEIIDARALEKVIEGLSSEDYPIERKTELEELWVALSSHPPISEVDFRTSIEYLIEAVTEERFGKVLGDAGEILTDGIKMGKETLYGLRDALEFVGESIADLNIVNQGDMPEGDIRNEEQELIDELYSGGAIKRFSTSIVPIDEFSHGGPGTGELWIPAAYTGVGKSTICINFAHSFVTQGHNVLYLTLETQRNQIRRRLLVRHANEPLFGLGGLSLDTLNKHTTDNPILTDEEIERYSRAVNDLTGNPNYGSVIIAQVPEKSTFNTIRTISKRWNAKKRIDVIVIDSLDLVGSDRSRREKRDELNEVIMAAKNMAMSFDNGRGVPIISPWQTSRDGYKAAKDRGHYVITDLGETSEIERKADCVIGMLEKPNSPDRLKANVLKWRDGKKIDFELQTNLDHSYIGSKESTDPNSDFDNDTLDI